MNRERSGRETKPYESSLLYSKCKKNAKKKKDDKMKGNRKQHEENINNNSKLGNTLDVSFGVFIASSVRILRKCSEKALNSHENGIFAFPPKKILRKSRQESYCKLSLQFWDHFTITNDFMIPFHLARFVHSNIKFFGKNKFFTVKSNPFEIEKKSPIGIFAK